jgi:hypothetical protein
LYIPNEINRFVVGKSIFEIDSRKVQSSFTGNIASIDTITRAIAKGSSQRDGWIQVLHRIPHW